MDGAELDDSAMTSPEERGIFICYRRDDAAGHAGWLRSGLVAEFGTDQVFMDVAGIQPGEEFDRTIPEAISSTAVFLVVIGRHWETVRGSSGARRLDEDNDPVRTEIEIALSHEALMIIPVLVHGAQMPHRDRLPETIREVANRHAATLRDESWDENMAHLCGAVEQGKAECAARIQAKVAGSSPATILARGVDAWNSWRVANSTIQPNLDGITLDGADLSGIDLTDTLLRMADLCGAKLLGARLIGTELSGTDVRGATVGATVFACDLSETTGLDHVQHDAPSEVSHTSLTRLPHPFPERFLRGCGVPDDLLEWARAQQSPFGFYSVFIAYSESNEVFAQRLHADLQDNGVRCWFAPANLHAGARLAESVSEAIRLHDKVVLILSEDSIESAWVEHEVDRALEEEERRGTDVLFPIRLDDTVLGCPFGWASRIRDAHKPSGRYIADFSNWKDHDAYKAAFERLLRDLKLGAATAAKSEGSDR